MEERKNVEGLTKTLKPKSCLWYRGIALNPDKFIREKGGMKRTSWGKAPVAVVEEVQQVCPALSDLII
jgi:hypothetical protein